MLLFWPVSVGSLALVYHIYMPLHCHDRRFTGYCNSGVPVLDHPTAG